MASLEVPKINLRFNNFPEELTELPEGCYTHGYSYYGERMEMRVSQGKKHIGQSLGEHEMWNFQWFFLWSQDDISLLVLISDNKHGILPIRKAHLSLSIWNFYQGSIRLGMIDHRSSIQVTCVFSSSKD